MYVMNLAHFCAPLSWPSSYYLGQESRSIFLTQEEEQPATSENGNLYAQKALSWSFGTENYLWAGVGFFHFLLVAASRVSRSGASLLSPVALAAAAGHCWSRLWE